MAEFNLDSWGLAIDRLGKELDKLKEAIPRRIASGEISTSEAVRILDSKRNEIQANKIEGGTWTYPKIEGGNWKYPTIEGGSWAYPKAEGGTWKYPTIEGGTWTYPTIEGGTWTDPKTGGSSPASNTEGSRTASIITVSNLDEEVGTWDSNVFENPEDYGPLIDSGGFLFLVSAQKLKLQKQQAERRATEQRRQKANMKSKHEAEVKAQKAKENKASQDRQKRNRESRQKEDLKRAEQNRSNVPGSSSQESGANSSSPETVAGINRFGGKIVGGTKSLEALLERKPGYGQDINRIKEAYNVREAYPTSDYKVDTQKRDYRNSIPSGYKSYLEQGMSQTPNDLPQINKPVHNRLKPLPQIQNRVVGGTGGATQIIGQGFQFKNALDEQNKYLKYRDYLKDKYGLTDSELLEVQKKYTPKLNYTGWLDGAQHASDELKPEGYDMYGPLGLEDAVKAYKKGMSPKAFRKMWGDDFGDPNAPVGPWLPSKPWGNQPPPKGGLGQGPKPLVSPLKKRHPLDDWENPYSGMTGDEAEEEFLRRNPWLRPDYVAPLDPNYTPIEDGIPAAIPGSDKPPAPDKDPRSKFTGYTISIRFSSWFQPGTTYTDSYFLAQPQFFEIEQPSLTEGRANHPDGWVKREYWGIKHAPGILFTPPWRDADTPDDVMPWASKTGVRGDRAAPIPIPEQWQTITIERVEMIKELGDLGDGDPLIFFPPPKLDPKPKTKPKTDPLTPREPQPDPKPAPKRPKQPGIDPKPTPKPKSPWSPPKPKLDPPTKPNKPPQRDPKPDPKPKPDPEEAPQPLPKPDPTPKPKPDPEPDRNHPPKPDPPRKPNKTTITTTTTTTPKPNPLDPKPNPLDPLPDPIPDDEDPDMPCRYLPDLEQPVSLTKYDPLTKTMQPMQFMVHMGMAEALQFLATEIAELKRSNHQINNVTEAQTLDTTGKIMVPQIQAEAVGTAIFAGAGITSPVKTLAGQMNVWASLNHMFAGHHQLGKSDFPTDMMNPTGAKTKHTTALGFNHWIFNQLSNLVGMPAKHNVVNAAGVSTPQNFKNQSDAIENIHSQNLGLEQDLSMVDKSLFKVLQELAQVKQIVAQNKYDIDVLIDESGAKTKQKIVKMPGTLTHGKDDSFFDKMMSLAESMMVVREWAGDIDAKQLALKTNMEAQIAALSNKFEFDKTNPVIPIVDRPKQNPKAKDDEDWKRYVNTIENPGTIRQSVGLPIPEIQEIKFGTAREIPKPTTDPDKLLGS